MNRMTIIVFTAAMLMLQGCASSLTGDTYSRSEARKVQNVEYAWVDAVKPVVIEGRSDSPLGAGAGAIVGGIAGSTVGGGKGSSIAAVVGAIAGGIVGQEVDSEGYFRPGERVRVLRQGSTARITR